MSPPTPSLRAPLLWLLLPGMAGIAAGDALPMTARWIPVLALSALGLAGLAGGLAGRRGALARGFWMLTIIGAGMAGGALALQCRSPRLNRAAEAPREVVIELEVEQLFTPSPRRKTVSGLGRIVATERHITGLTGQRVYFSAIRRIGVPPALAGRYEVRGVLAARPEAAADAGFQRYLDSAGIRLALTRAQVVRERRAPGWFRRFCTRTETRLEAILRQGLERHPEETALYLGMLLGEMTTLSAEQQSAFMRSGTFHIFSISGLHVGVIATAILSLLQLARLSRRTATVVGLIILWLYVQVTGASVPAERAFLMIAFLSSSRLFRLPANPLAGLAAAALVTLGLDPRQLFSTGFQMSYAVVTALVLLSAPLTARWQAAWQPWRALPELNWDWRHRWSRWLGREIISGWSATWVALLTSIPTSIGYFRLFSPGSLVANLVVIPLSTLAIIAGFASLIGGLAGLTGVSLIFNRAALVIIRTLDWLVLHGTALPGVYFPAQFTAPWLAPVSLVFLLAVMLAGASLHWPRRWGATWWPVLAVMLLLCFGVKFG